MKSEGEFAAGDALLGELAALPVDDDRRERIRARIVEVFQPLARSVAARFRGRGEPVEDLEQVAAMGLVKAVDRFDPERGVAFLGYAIPTMMGEVRRYFRDTAWSVRVPRRLSELHVALNAAIRDLTQENGRPPTPKELAARLSITVDEVQEGLESGQYYRSASLDATVESGEAPSLLGTLGVEDHGFEVAEVRAVLEPALATVAERERRILAMRFFDGMTQAQIADKVGLSQMQVSRLLARTLERLRDVMEKPPE